MFYDNFSTLCTKKGVSCNKVATDIGLSGAAVTKWRKTGATPRYETLVKLAEYLDVPISNLVDDKKEAQPKPDGLQEFQALYSRLNLHNREIVDNLLEQLVAGQQGK